MKTPITVALVATLALAGCGGFRESRLNPFNWFKSQRSGPPADDLLAANTDPRPLVAQVTRLEVRPTPTGAIVAAAGLPPTQGWWDAELVPENDGKPVDGVLTYRFVVKPPPYRARVSTPQSRELIAGAALSNIALRDVRRIVVAGAANSLSSSR